MCSSNKKEDIKMSTVIRAEVSTANPYYITKHRYYELKHFCMQYKEWEKNVNYLTSNLPTLSSASVKHYTGHNTCKSDKTAKIGMLLAEYTGNIKLINECCRETDPYLANFILKSVTEGLSYTTLRTVHNIPCGKDYFYERYRKFFWILSNKR